MPAPDLFQEADRQLVICNACRYCEGYCPVFRAIETRREFGKGDVFYLANLCHDCRACYYACMYTAPHEFDINIPRILSEVRIAGYARWSWPTLLARSFTSRRVGATFAVLVAGAVIALASLLVAPTRIFGLHTGPGAFYQVIPYLAMVLPAALLFMYAIGIWINGGARFWLDTGQSARQAGGMKAVIGALAAIVSLRYLKGGGPGCNYPQQRVSESRRIYHSLVFWGFLSATVSTTLAGIYQDFLHWIPPFALTSAPVIFGSMGGVAVDIVGIRRANLDQAAKRPRTGRKWRIRNGLYFSCPAGAYCTDWNADAGATIHGRAWEHFDPASGADRGALSHGSVRKICPRRISVPGSA